MSRALLSDRIRLLLIISLVYFVAWFAHYSRIPAGQYPIDEVRATLDTARALAQGLFDSQSDAQGYSLYTYILSILARFFDTESGVVAAARGLNALALMFVTALGASAARRYWQSKRAAWIAGLLIGLNPVLIFWAGEVSPALLATAGFSLALAYLLRWLRNARTRYSFFIGTGLAAASALQTSLLPLALLWPALAFFYPLHQRLQHLYLSLLPIALFTGIYFASNLTLHPPWQWSTENLGAGAYSALASPELFESKNFAFYRQLHPLLLLNPIHWGLLFILASAGFYAHFRQRETSPSLYISVAILFIFALSFASNEGGSQSRATMIPLLAILAAGSYQMPKIWRRAKRPRRRLILTAGLLLAGFSYAPYFYGDSSQSWERDYAHMARAHLEFGQNEHAINWAEKTLKLNPERADMHAILVIAEFNHWALGSVPRSLSAESARALLESSKSAEPDSTIRTIQAIYQYKLRDSKQAFATWQAERKHNPLALLCLYWTGQASRAEVGDLSAFAGLRYDELLQSAVQVDRNALAYGDLESLIDNLLAFAY